MTDNITIHHQGNEQQPVIVIDNFHPEPSKLIEEASQQRFARTVPFYPGVRAPISQSYYTDLPVQLSDIVQQVFGYGAAPGVEGCCYSLVTMKPEELMPIQRLPHYDGVDPGKLAVLHYLSDESQGGTAFYRHRATGFETVTQDRFEVYKQALEADVRKFGMPPQAYFTRSNDMFEQIGAYEAKFNRALIYRGITLHSGMIPDDCTFAHDPASGRLTVNTFLVPA
jgi:hypothetical protein